MKFSHILDEVIDWLKTLVIAVAIAVLLRSFVISPFQVSLTSMYPTLHPDDLILVEKLSKRFGTINYGQIVVFQAPLGENKDFVKRVIAIPGGRLESRNGKVYVNDLLVDEKYLTQEFEVSIMAQTLKENEYFVLGDNRDNSLDSRNFGTISLKDIKGKVVLIFWPWNRWQIMNYNQGS